MEISNLPNKEFRATIIKMLNELRRRMDEHNEKFNRKKKNQTVGEYNNRKK